LGSWFNFSSIGEQVVDSGALGEMLLDLWSVCDTVRSEFRPAGLLDFRQGSLEKTAVLYG